MKLLSVFMNQNIESNLKLHEEDATLQSGSVTELHMMEPRVKNSTGIQVFAKHNLTFKGIKKEIYLMVGFRICFLQEKNPRVKVFEEVQSKLQSKICPKILKDLW